MIRFFKNMTRKQIIICIIVAVFFVVGITPKIIRYITTLMNSRANQYVAIVETPKLVDGEDTLELSGELKPFFLI